jgi:hypothetical protein
MSGQAKSRFGTDRIYTIKRQLAASSLKRKMLPRSVARVSKEAAMKLLVSRRVTLAMALGAVVAATSAAQAVHVGLPTLTKIKPIAINFGINHVASFTSDGRPATIVLSRRENGNAHGYDVMLVTIDHAMGEHIEPVPDLVEVEATDHPWDDLIRVDTFDGENTLSAVRIVHASISGAPATLLIKARRAVGKAPALTDAMPVELSVYQLDGPREDVGRTPDAFLLIGNATTSQRYCNADVALSKEMGVPLPDGDFEETPDGCPSAVIQDLKSAAAEMIKNLDMTSFANSIGPRRKPGAYTLAQYGFTSFTSFGDGWAEAEEADHSWSFRIFVLNNGDRKKRLCVIDAAHGGTYHTTEAVDVAPSAGGLWKATSVLGQVPGCHG